MRINLQGKNMDLTGPISDYVEKKVTNLGRLLVKMEERNGEVAVHFEVEKTTNHHKQGEFFKAEFDITINGKKFFAQSNFDRNKSDNSAKHSSSGKWKKKSKQYNSSAKYQSGNEKSTAEQYKSSATKQYQIWISK